MSNSTQSTSSISCMTPISRLTVEASSVDQLIEIVRDAGPDLLGEQAAAAEYDFQIHLPAAA